MYLLLFLRNDWYRFRRYMEIALTLSSNSSHIHQDSNDFITGDDSNINILNDHERDGTQTK